MNVLVAVASSHGSTWSIGNRIGHRLSERGHEVDVRSVEAVHDVTIYDTVIIGSAVHGGRWLASGSDFVRRHSGALQHRPVWLYSVSCVGSRGGAFTGPVNRLLRSLRRETGQIKGFRAQLDVQGHRDFAGVVDKDHWPLSGRLVFRLLTGRFGDHRDWADIDSWSDRIASSGG